MNLTGSSLRVPRMRGNVLIDSTFEKLMLSTTDNFGAEAAEIHIGFWQCQCSMLRTRPSLPRMQRNVLSASRLIWEHLKSL
jgi:hypothetical protein